MRCLTLSRLKRPLPASIIALCLLTAVYVWLHKREVANDDQLTKNYVVNSNPVKNDVLRNSELEKFISKEVISSTAGEAKLIAFGTNHFNGKWDYLIKKFKSQPASSCNTKCSFTTDIYRAHAVIFHSSTLSEKSISLPRQQHQYWIYYTLESPYLTKNLGYNVGAKPHLFRFAFNFTQTCMYNTDLWGGYGKVVKRKTELPSSTELYNPKLKKHFAFIFISNCKGAFNVRLQKVYELKKFMPIDVYGKCSHDETLREAGKDPAALYKFGKTYRYSLGFMNYLCKDYISERFFESQDSEAVSVAFGGMSRKDFEAVSPPKKSFIFAEDFKSMQELAKFLIDLANDEQRYAEYFNWKRQYKVTIYMPPALCSVCEMLHNANNKKHVADLSEYYNVEKNCRPMESLFKSKLHLQ